MQQIEPLNFGKFYHIYNRGINSCDLFKEQSDYQYFLGLYEKFISPVADTYAWVLMKNHFHLLVKIRENVVYKYSNADRSIDAVRFEEQKWETTDLSACKAPDSVIAANNVKAPDSVIAANNVKAPDSVIAANNVKAFDIVPAADMETYNIKIPKAYLHFSHLFNAYSKYFNKMYGRHGSLFERSFKRKEITDIEYFKNLVVYIHNNPVHHKFTEHAMDYPWSSYLTCISVKPTHLKRDAVIGWFDNQANFKTAHENPGDVINLEKWLGL